MSLQMNFQSKSKPVISVEDLREAAAADLMLLKCVDTDPTHNAGVPCFFYAWWARPMAEKLVTRVRGDWELAVDPVVELTQVEAQINEH